MPKKKKIMTISDLYNFCMKNNFCHFSSATNNEEICVQMPAIFEKEEKVDKDKEGLTPFVAKAYHDHINLNKSEIKPEVLENTLPSAMLRPILASIVIDEETGAKDFGSHDFVFEEDEDGNERIRYIEQPVGVIFGDNTIEYDEDDDVNRAILHGYLYDGYCQDAVDIMNRRKTVDCSVELSIREMSFNTADKVLILDDFYVSGLTLLNSKVNPGMKGSKVTIEDFSKTNNSMFSENEELLNEIKKLNDNLSHFNINASLKEGGNAVTKFEELLNQYSKTVEDITFDYENLSDEELESKFAETFDETENIDTVEDEPEDEDDAVDEEEGTDNTDIVDLSDAFEVSKAYTIDTDGNMILSYAISHEDIRSALYQLIRQYDELDNEWYFVDRVFDDSFEFMNWEGTKIFRQTYKRDGDNVSFDGERIELYQERLTSSEKIALDEMRTNYSALKEFKSKTEYELEQAKFQGEIDEIFNSEQYVTLAQNEAFNKLKTNFRDFSVDEIRTQCKLIFADHILSQGQFTLNKKEENKSNKINFNLNAKPEKKPYGSLFDEITKTK